MSLIIIPIELYEANYLVSKYHRHHKEVQGHRFSVGLWDNSKKEIIGAVVVGRPVARLLNYRTILEVTRLVTDGTKNACSMLYSASARIAKEMGYSKIQTYILDTETGISLKASGWICELSDAGGGQWKHTDGKARRTDQPINSKQRWVKYLREDGEWSNRPNKAGLLVDNQSRLI